MVPRKEISGMFRHAQKFFFHKVPRTCYFPSFSFAPTASTEIEEIALSKSDFWISRIPATLPILTKRFRPDKKEPRKSIPDKKSLEKKIRAYKNEAKMITLFKNSKNDEKKHRIVLDVYFSVW